MRIKIGSGIWLIVGAVVCVIILVLGLFLIVFPQKNKVGEIESEIEDVEMSIQQEQNKLNQLKQYEKDPQQFVRQVEVLEEKIPETVELADIIQQIDHAAEEAGLDFCSFTPSTPVANGNFYSVTCDTEFQGRYFNLVEFFNQVERLPRTVKAVYLEVEEADAGLPYLRIRITFRCFFTTEQGVEQILQAGG